MKEKPESYFLMNGLNFEEQLRFFKDLNESPNLDEIKVSRKKSKLLRSHIWIDNQLIILGKAFDTSQHSTERTKVDFIGQGCFGRVKIGYSTIKNKKGKHELTGERRAIKIIIAHHEEDKECVEKEAYFIKKFGGGSKGCLWITQENPLLKVAYIDMEYFEGQQLGNFDEDQSLDQKLTFAIKICEKVNFFHQNNFYHGDLDNEENILYDQETVEIRIVDFGNSVETEEPNLSKQRKDVRCLAEVFGTYIFSKDYDICSFLKSVEQNKENTSSLSNVKNLLNFFEEYLASIKNNFSI